MPLKERFSILYNMVINHHTIMGQMTLDISSRRALTGNKFIDWHNLVAKKAHIHSSNKKDTFTWDLHKYGQFSVCFMHQYMLNLGVVFSFWGWKFWLNLKILLWYLQRGAILTKGNLAKRNWTGIKSIVSVTAMKQLSMWSIWRIVHIATGLTPPWSMSHMLGAGLLGKKKREKKIN